MASPQKFAATVVGSGLLLAPGIPTAHAAPPDDEVAPSIDEVSALAHAEDLAELGADELAAVDKELASIAPTALASSSSQRPRVDWGYKDCPAANSAIYETGITWRHGSYSNRTVFATVPSGYARYGSVPDSWTDDELWRCIPSSPSPSYRVRSWQGIYDQFDCHDLSPGGIGTGPTWDLEGHRGATRNRWTWVYNRCNW